MGIFIRRPLAVAFVVLGVGASSVPADAYVDTGRDGADPHAWLDIRSTTRRVWSGANGHRYVTVSVRGAEAYYLAGPLKVRVRLDARGDGLRDAVMVMRNGDTASGQRRDCVVRADGVAHDGTLLFGTRVIACRIRAPILRPGKRIRWKVTSSQYDALIDRAPDRGWYPSAQLAGVR